MEADMVRESVNSYSDTVEHFALMMPRLHAVRCIFEIYLMLVKIAAVI